MTKKNQSKDKPEPVGSKVPGPDIASTPAPSFEPGPSAKERETQKED